MNIKYSLACLILFLAFGCSHKIQPIYPDNAPKIISDYNSWKRTDGGMRKKAHTGIDIAGDIGTPIIAAADGKVVFSGHLDYWGYGVLIDHGEDSEGNSVRSFYLHNHRNEVNEGDFVKRGQKIAEMGKCERCFKTHLHFAVWVGKFEDKGKDKPFNLPVGGDWKK